MHLYLLPSNHPKFIVLIIPLRQMNERMHVTVSLNYSIIHLFSCLFFVYFLNHRHFF
ncbi:hypothetical protein LEPN108286_00390 [Legionella pneumophila subsp. pneumophila]